MPTPGPNRERPEASPLEGDDEPTADQDAFNAFMGVKQTEPNTTKTGEPDDGESGGEKIGNRSTASPKGKKAKQRQPRASAVSHSPSTPTPSRVRWWLLAVIVALLAVIVAAAGILWWRSRETAATPTVAVDSGRPPADAPFRQWKLNPGCPDCKLAADDTSFYVASPYATVEAYDLASGTRKWSASLSFRPNQLHVRSGTVLVGTGPADKVQSASIDAMSGQVRWEREGLFKPPTDPAAPTLLMETATADTSTTHLVDIAGGQERWKTPGVPWTVCGDVAVVGDSGSVRAVSMTDGIERWKAAVSDPSNVSCTGTVVAALADTYAVAFDRGQGQQLWRKDIATSALVAAGDLVLMGGQELVAVDATTGADRWTAPGGDFLLGARMVGKDKLAVFGVGASLRNRADGQPIVTLPGDDPDLPAVVETTAGYLHRESPDRVTLRHPTTFESKWSFTAVGGVRAMASGDGRLVVLDEKGDLVGYS